MKWHQAKTALATVFEGGMLLLMYAAIYACFYLFGGPVK